MLLKQNINHTNESSFDLSKKIQKITVILLKVSNNITSTPIPMITYIIYSNFNLGVQFGFTLELDLEALIELSGSLFDKLLQ